MHVVALLNQSLVDNNPEIESKYHHHNVCLVFLTHFLSLQDVIIFRSMFFFYILVRIYYNS
jgi:hypothetical protein